MDNWRELIRQVRRDVTLRDEFLEVRAHAEDGARMLLNRKAGAFTQNDLVTFLRFCNTEMIPRHNTRDFRKKETCTRFGPLFVGRDRQLLLQSLDVCNYWIDRLWRLHGDPTETLDKFWACNQVAGAGTGLPTMVLYLKEPAVFSVWLPFLTSALSILTKKPFPSQRTAQNYLLYTTAVNDELRQALGLRPQEIDYILFRIGRAKDSRQKY